MIDKRLVPFAIVVVLCGLLAWMLLTDRDPDTTEHEMLGLTRQPQGGDFTLRSAAGPVSLSDFRGKVVLLYFGYTWCPDICPLNLGYLTMALDSLRPQERERVQVLFVSVDPERDTPRRLTEYTAFFAPDILGATGTEEQVARAAGLYGAAYRRVEGTSSAMGYAVDHSAYTYLVDQDGRLRQSLEHATPADQIASAIRLLLQEGESR